MCLWFKITSTVPAMNIAALKTRFCQSRNMFITLLKHSLLRVGRIAIAIVVVRFYFFNLSTLIVPSTILSLKFFSFILSLP